MNVAIEKCESEANEQNPVLAWQGEVLTQLNELRSKIENVKSFP